MHDPKNLEVFQLQAELCKSLGDPKRLMIIHELRNSEKSVGELSVIVGGSQPNVSQHLAVLRKSGLLTTRRQGNVIYYSLANSKIAEACDMVRQVLMDQLKESQGLVQNLRVL